MIYVLSCSKDGPVINIGVWWLPLLDTFRTFCWNRLREELTNLERMNPLFAALWIDQECNSLAN